MKKIDNKLLNFIILSQEDCKLEGVVYCLDKNKTINFFNENNIKILKELPFINAFIVCFNSEKIIKTANQSFVTYISSVSNVSALINVSKKILAINNITQTGKGVTMAFIDTGVSCHLDFVFPQKRILKFCDFVKGLNFPYDDNGHGTFITGVACGNGIVSNGKFAGIAKNSNIISLKSLNEKGEASAVTILEAMQWIYDNRKKYNIKVVCMSFGSEPLGKNDPIMKGAEKLWEEGVCVVCAGGNSGPELETIKSPGVSRKIITVGGLDDKRDEFGNYNEKNFSIATFSSRGPAFGRLKPDIIAPSVNIVSCSRSGEYRKMSGTSVATPMVAGICSLIFEKYPKASPDQIKKFLQFNAKSIKALKIEEGYGLLNFTNIVDF